MELLKSVLAVLGISQGVALASSQPEYLTVDSIQINGSGCSNQYVGWDQWYDVLQVRTPAYSIQLNQNSRFERKNCQAIVDILKPHGWTYRVARIKVTGWAQVAGKVNAAVTNSHYIQGQIETDTAKLEIRPWFRKNYSLVNDSKGEWAPCGVDRALNVNTAIILRRNDSGNEHAYLKVNPNIRVRLDWKRC